MNISAPRPTRPGGRVGCRDADLISKVLPSLAERLESSRRFAGAAGFTGKEVSHDKPLSLLGETAERRRRRPEPDGSNRRSDHCLRGLPRDLGFALLDAQPVVGVSASWLPPLLSGGLFATISHVRGWSPAAQRRRFSLRDRLQRGPAPPARPRNDHRPTPRTTGRDPRHPQRLQGDDQVDSSTPRGDLTTDARSTGSPPGRR